MLCAFIGFQSMSCKAYFGTERILDLEHNIVIWLGSYCIHQYEKGHLHFQNSDHVTATILADAIWNAYNAYSKYLSAPDSTTTSELFQVVCLEAFYQTTFDIGIYAATRYILGSFGQYLTSKESTPLLNDVEKTLPNKEVTANQKETTDIKDPYIQIREMKSVSEQSSKRTKTKQKR